MKIRELLQRELWSKSTTRKILARVGKVLVRVGIVLGVLAVVIVIVLAIEIHWMTAGERKVATEALSEIDVTQNFVYASDNDFETRFQQAKKTVEAAKRTAWTIRDKDVVMWLSIDLDSIENDRNQARRMKEMRAFLQENGIPYHSNPVSEANDDVLKAQIRLLNRSVVVRLLQ
jgi:hypothetical protein